MPLTYEGEEKPEMYDRLTEVYAEKSVRPRPALSCAIVGAGDQFAVTITDPTTKEELWVYAGEPDAIVNAFRLWLNSL